MDVPNMNMHTYPSKTRRFVPRRKYHKWKKIESTKRNLDLIHNFSSINLSSDMISLLNKGPGFVPVEKSLNITQTMADISRYDRRMKWHEYFSHEEQENIQKDLNVSFVTTDFEEDKESIQSIFKSEKCNLPKSKVPQSLSTFLAAVKSDILGSCKKSNKLQDNLTPKERESMQLLIQAQSSGQIQIKPVNKRGEFAILNLSDYLDEMSSQLKAKFTHENGSSSNYYEKTDIKALEMQKKCVIQVIEKGVQLNLISKADKSVMLPSGNPNRLYGLPKVHKGIKEGKNIPPCRPIVSNSGSNTEMISAFVDHYSKHLVKDLKSYVQDSPDFLRIIEKENDRGPQLKNAFPFTVDVTSLYTSIPARGENGGIQAFKSFLNSRSSEEQITMPTDFFVECLELVLDGNIFTFNEELHVQKIGTAMGTKLALTYACIFMAWLEEDFLHKKMEGNPTFNLQALY